MKIDVMAPTRISIPQTVAFVNKSEKSGATGVGIPDHLEFGRDGFIALALASQNSSRVQLYPAVTNILTRHPFQLAVLARSMQELAPNRNKLVIGIGGTTALHTGMGPATREQIREVIPILRKLLQGEAVTFGSSNAERIEDPDPRGPEIQFAASGPKSIKLAAEIADGALVFVGISDGIRNETVELIGNQLEKMGRIKANFEITFNTMLSVDHDEATALERIRNAAHNWLKLGRFKFGFNSLGISPKIPNKPSDLDIETLSRIAENFFIVGTPQQCYEKIRALSSKRLGRLLLMNASSDTEDLFFEVLKEITAENTIHSFS